MHGRTRACAFVGPVEYETIAAVKAAVGIPVFANGDIATPAQAGDVLARTGADGLMIGRAAQGRPWIFREIAHYLATGTLLAPPTVAEARTLIAGHLRDHYDFYGEELGVRIARKHLAWYTEALPGAAALRAVVNETTSAAAQMAAMDAFFDALALRGERLAYQHTIMDPQRARQRQSTERSRAGEALAA